MTIPGLMQDTPLTLRMIFDRLRTVHADGEVVSPRGRTTYGQLADRVLRLARVLVEDLGVRPGDRVATFAHNSVRHLELYYAVPLVGAVLHTLNMRLHHDEIAYIAAHAGDRVVFFDWDEDFGPALAKAAPRLSEVRQWVRLSGHPGGSIGDAHDYDELVHGVAPLSPSDLPQLDEGDACGLCYTSGTTGMPKGVLYSHRGTVLHALAACMVDHLGLSEHDRVLPVVPMYHAFGWSLPYAGPFTGTELVLHGRDTSPERIGRLIDDERVTVAAGVPTIWKTLLPLVRDGRCEASSLRMIAVGGSASPRSLIEAYETAGIGYLQVWGMTETGPLACASRRRRAHRDLSRDEILDQQAKTGTIFAGLQARVVGEDDEALPWDGSSVGELEVRGPWVASSYYPGEDPTQEDVAAIDARFHDGWLRTGDIARMEPNGCFTVVDRAKDLVKSGGEWISSVALEGHLVGHPEIADAAVVGVPSRRWDERPVAAVVPADPACPPSLEAVHGFLAGRVVKWWYPDAVVVVDEIPQTSVGKIDKRALRERLDDMVLD